MKMIVHSLDAITTKKLHFCQITPSYPVLIFWGENKRASEPYTIKGKTTVGELSAWEGRGRHRIADAEASLQAEVDEANRDFQKITVDHTIKNKSR